MNNNPIVSVDYLPYYALNIVENSQKNDVCDISSINDRNNDFQGKKGLFMSGGSVDTETGEVSGCIMDGSYTLFDITKKYKGYVGTELSKNDYTFTNSQYITIRTTEDKTFINSLLIYFDKVAGEYATEISFSNATKIDNGQEVADTDFDNFPTQYNNGNIFVFNFGEDRPLKQIRINFLKWNKKNSLVKVTRIVTGFTCSYDKSVLRKLDYTRNKVNDSSMLRFGLSTNECTFSFYDRDFIIEQLYEKDLLYKNIQVSINIDGLFEGVYYLNEKSSQKGTNEWTFDCVDGLELLKNIISPALPIASRKLYDLVNIILSYVSKETIWEINAKSYCNNTIIDKSFLNAGQTLYDALLKCCQVGLLRIYADKNGTIKITSGVN